MKAGKKCFFAIFLLLLIGLSEFVLRPQNIKPKGYQELVGIVLNNATNPQNARLLERAKSLAPLQTGRKILLKESQNNAKQQLKDIEELLQYGIDLLVIAPIWEPEVEELLQSLQGKLPLLILHEERAKYLGQAFVAFDNRAAGKAIAELALAEAKPEDRFLLLGDSVENSPEGQRTMAMQAALEAKGQSYTLLQLQGHSNEAENMMKYFLVSEQSANIVLASNEQRAYGAWLAAQKLRSKGLQYYAIDGIQKQNQQSIAIWEATAAFPELLDSVLAVVDSLKQGENFIEELFLMPVIWRREK